jgi:hypothetical protein
MNDYEPLKGFEKLYAINRDGSVWSLFSNKQVKPNLGTWGYYDIRLSKNGSRKTCKLHRLLAQQFIPNPDNFRYIDHINRIRTDNRLENLRWVSCRQNNNNRSDNVEHNYITINSCGNYKVAFYVNKKMKYFGTYKILEEALNERDCQLDLHGLPNYCWD